MQVNMVLAEWRGDERTGGWHVYAWAFDAEEHARSEAAWERDDNAATFDWIRKIDGQPRRGFATFEDAKEWFESRFRSWQDAQEWADAAGRGFRVPEERIVGMEELAYWPHPPREKRTSKRRR